MVTQKNFKCINCGLCCHAIVEVNDKEISRIKELGHKESDFLIDHQFNPGQKILKRENGKCVFLRYDEQGKSSCMVHSKRPGTCKDFPFIGKTDITDCRPPVLIEKNLNEARELLNKRGFI